MVSKTYRAPPGKGGFFWDSLQVPVVIGQLQRLLPGEIQIYVDTMLDRDDVIVRACAHRHVHVEVGMGGGHGSLIAALIRGVALARLLAEHDVPPVSLVQSEIEKILVELPDLLADAPPALREFLIADPNLLDSQLH